MRAPATCAIVSAFSNAAFLPWWFDRRRDTCYLACLRNIRGAVLLNNLFRPVYDWMMKQAGGRHAPWMLAVISFAEASFFPIPPDVMLIPMVLARRERAWSYAAICAAASILGGCLGYYIGYALEPFGLAILRFFGHSEGIEAYRRFYGHWGFFIILGQGITPIPYKLTTIATGLAHFPLWQFMLASCMTRTTRFFVVAGLSRRFGPAIIALVEKRMLLVGSIVLGMIVLGFVIVKFWPHHS